MILYVAMQVRSSQCQLNEGKKNTKNINTLIGTGTEGGAENVWVSVLGCQ